MPRPDAADSGRDAVGAIEGLPGEFSQHDFGEVRGHYQNRTEEIVHVFASRLKCSRWAEV